MGCKVSSKVSPKFSQPHQPRPKDIPIELDVREECTVKDERETADNTELTGVDIRGIITKALEESLMGYKVYGQAIPPEILKPIRLLEVKRNNKITVTPDNTGTFLTHGLLPTKYDLYAAVNRIEKRIVFLYQWEALKDQIFVACPYIRDPTAGSIIPCVEANITNALQERYPVRAVMKVLEKITTDDFHWVMDGSDNDFTISAPGEKIFWRDVNGCRDIRLTDNGSIKLVLQLEVVEGSPLQLCD